MDLQKFLEGEINNEKKSNKIRIRFLDNFIKGKQSNIYLDPKQEFLFKIMYYIFFLVIILFVIRSFNLQIIDFDKYYNLSVNNFLRSKVIYPNRGLIYDRNNNLLVTNIPYYAVYLNVGLCANRSSSGLYDECIKELNNLKQYLDFDKNSIESKLNPDRILLIKRNLKKEDIESLLVNIDTFKSIEIIVIPIREYKYPESLAHVIGYVSEGDSYQDFEGKDGIELYYNPILSGIKGYSASKVDSYNSKIDNFSGLTPVPGKNLKLTIDSNLQDYIYLILKEKVIKTPNSTGGSVVVMNPQTGEVLALVNYPSYDAQKFSFGISQKEYEELINNPGKPFFNRAISGVYPPGSVFKAITAAGILEEGIAKPGDSIFDKGSIKIGNYVFSNWKLDGHGEVDLDRAMKVSNDTYFYIFTGGYDGKKGLGIDKLHDWAIKFNLGKITGIDLYGEAKGFMPDGTHKQWYLGDTYISAIGQGDILATPLQMTVMTSYFATDQKAYKPYLVSEIDEKIRNRKVLYENLLSSENFNVVKKSLKSVNDAGGTGNIFQSLEKKHGFETGGKTGTSEFLKNGVMTTHAWYSGFAPFDNSEIVVTVFLEDGGGGSLDAAPLTLEIMDFYFSNKK